MQQPPAAAAVPHTGSDADESKRAQPLGPMCVRREEDDLREATGSPPLSASSPPPPLPPLPALAIPPLHSLSLSSTARTHPSPFSSSSQSASSARRNTELLMTRELELKDREHEGRYGHLAPRTPLPALVVSLGCVPLLPSVCLPLLLSAPLSRSPNRSNSARQRPSRAERRDGGKGEARLSLRRRRRWHLQPWPGTK